MFKYLSSAATVLVLGAGSALAADLRDGEIWLREVIRGTQVTFEAKGWPEKADGVMVSIEGPGKYLRKDEFGGSVPAFDLQKFDGFMDGLYFYEISGSTGKQTKVKELVDNGREKAPSEFSVVSFSLSGRLVVERGQIVVFEQPEEKGSDKPVKGDPDFRDDDQSGSGRDQRPRDDEPDGEVPGDVKDSDG